MDAIPLINFKGIHTNKIAWLFGKGSSFDRWMQNPRAGKLRVCINQTVNIVPDPTYFFAVDYTAIHSCFPPNNCTCMLASRLRYDRTSDTALLYRTIAPSTKITVYQHPWVSVPSLLLKGWKMFEPWTNNRRCFFDMRINRQKALIDPVVNHLYIKSSTAQSAVHFLAHAGVKTIMCVGIDGGNGYSQIIEDQSKTHPRVGHYDIALDATKMVAQILGVQLIFY